MKSALRHLLELVWIVLMIIGQASLTENASVLSHQNKSQIHKEIVEIVML